VIDLTQSPSLDEVVDDCSSSAAPHIDDVSTDDNVSAFPKIPDDKHLSMMDYPMPVPNLSTLQPVTSALPLFQRGLTFTSV